MPDFTFTSPDGKSYTVSGPEGATQEQAFGMLQKQIGAPPAAAPQGFMANAADLIKSIPHGLMQGIAGTLSAAGKSAAGEQGFAEEIPSKQETQKILEKNVTGQTHVPQGRYGKIGSAIGEPFGDPTTFVGPGSLPLKIGGAILGGAGSEVAGQAAEGTPYEAPARIAGALAGGVGAVKTLGPKAAAAEIPVSRAAWEAGPSGKKIITGEPGLKEIAGGQYKEAQSHNVELDPQRVADQAKLIEHKIGPGFDADTAPVTTRELQKLQTPGTGELSTLTNIDNVRKKLNEIAKLTDSTGKQTSDAAAATAVKRHLGDYLETDALDHVVVRDPKQAAKLVTEYLKDQPGVAQQVIAQARAGNAAPLQAVLKDAAKANATKAINTYKEANANWAAYRRAKGIEDTKLLGENQAERQTAGSEARRIRTNVGRIQDRITKADTTIGYSGEELAGIKKANKGGVISRALDQGGRLSGALPLLLHGITAIGTGGAHLPLQAAIAGGSYGAKKIAEALTRRQIDKLSETMRKRSPEFERRLANVPSADRGPAIAAIARALATGVH